MYQYTAPPQDRRARGRLPLFDILFFLIFLIFFVIYFLFFFIFFIFYRMGLNLGDDGGWCCGGKKLFLVDFVPLWVVLCGWVVYFLVLG